MDVRLISGVFAILFMLGVCANEPACSCMPMEVERKQMFQDHYQHIFSKCQPRENAMARLV